MGTEIALFESTNTKELRMIIRKDKLFSENCNFNLILNDKLVTMLAINQLNAQILFL